MEALELEKEVAPMAYSSHAALYIVTAPGPLKLPTYIDIRDAEANVHALMTRTGMTLEYAHLALCATEWRLGKAVEAFERCKVCATVAAIHLTRG